MAEDSMTRYGCTVTARRPKFAGIDEASGIRKADFQIEVTCPKGGRTVTVEQKLYEKDLEPVDPDDLLKRKTHTHEFTEGGSTVFHHIRQVPDTDWGVGDDTEELYHRARFRVSIDDVVSAWTGWVTSKDREMQQ